MAGIKSAAIREWARIAGGASEVWRAGPELAGWIAEDGTRAIETAGEPEFSESTEDPRLFAACWDQQTLDPIVGDE